MSRFLVDPSDVIKFDRTDDELELFWLFCGVVAGKTASTQAKLLDAFLESLPSVATSPFTRIRDAAYAGELLEHLRLSRLGQYNRLYAFMWSSSRDLNLRTCTVEDLEAIHGCGPKTARFFIMDTRPNQRLAAIDTHVLKHLRANGILTDAEFEQQKARLLM